jgi:hypothetical protein
LANRASSTPRRSNRGGSFVIVTLEQAAEAVRHVDVVRIGMEDGRDGL